MNSSLVRSNKASTLFHEANHKKLATIKGHEKKEPFKMEKFKNVPARTNTHITS